MSLSPPSEAARLHSAQLQEHLITTINQHGGRIAFSDYMQMALYQPGLGYYSAGTHKIGAAGDFVTAPEISPLFSQCLARQCQQVLATLDEGVIIEFGAGLGTMAADILLTLQQQNSLPKNYFIIEVSADLRQRQQQKLQAELPDYFSHIIWLDGLPEKPVNGVVLANEVLDAMPVNRFTLSNNKVQEVYVGYQQDTFVDVLVDSEQDVPFAHFADGYTSEVNGLLKPWLKSVEGIVAQGVILLIDYGFPAREYYHPDRSMGTLMCHYRHHAHGDPYYYPGLQDITAHVDFTAVANTTDLALAGFTSQAAFLLNCGLLDFLKTPDINRNKQVNILTSPSEMGELFKVMALAKNYDQPLIGFSQFDKRGRL